MLVERRARGQAGAGWQGIEKFNSVRYENGDLVVRYRPVSSLPSYVVCPAIITNAGAALTTP